MEQLPPELAAMLSAVGAGAAQEAPWIPIDLRDREAIEAIVERILDDNPELAALHEPLVTLFAGLTLDADTEAALAPVFAILANLNGDRKGDDALCFAIVGGTQDRWSHGEQYHATVIRVDRCTRCRFSLAITTNGTEYQFAAPAATMVLMMSERGPGGPGATAEDEGAKPAPRRAGSSWPGWGLRRRGGAHSKPN